MKKLIVILFLFSVGCRLQTVRCWKVLDGDTFITSTQEHVRILYIDSPEKLQAYGLQAKEFAERHLLHANIKIERHGKDVYGRSLCIVNADGADFSYLLVSEGLAHASLGAPQSLKMAYFKARQEKKGLFSQSWIYPYQFRKLYK